MRVEAEIDLRSRMVNAVARVGAGDGIPGDSTYVPPPVGLFVAAEILGLSADSVSVVPRSAIRNGNQVLVVDEDDRLRFRTVKIARIYGDDAYIDGGLERGERVCLTVLQAVVEGMRVEVVEDESAAAPGADGS